MRDEICDLLHFSPACFPFGARDVRTPEMTRIIKTFSGGLNSHIQGRETFGIYLFTHPSLWEECLLVNPCCFLNPPTPPIPRTKPFEDWWHSLECNKSPIFLKTIFKLLQRFFFFLHRMFFISPSLPLKNHQLQWNPFCLRCICVRCNLLTLSVLLLRCLVQTAYCLMLSD